MAARLACVKKMLLLGKSRNKLLMRCQAFTSPA